MCETTDLPLERVLMDAIEDMIFIMRVGEDSTFYYDFLNRAAMKGTGLTQAVLGKSIQEVYSTEKANLLIGYYNNAATSLKSVTYEDSHTSPLGERFYSEIQLTPLFNKMNKCSHIVALVQDITEKKWGEFELIEYWGKLHENKQRYYSLFNYNPNAIFSLNLKGEIIDGNTAVESVTGYEVNELIDVNFIDLFEQNHVDRTKEYFKRVLAGTAGNFQMTTIKKTGKNSELMLSFIPIIVNKEVVGVYAILIDVTEKIQITEKYKESEQRFRIIAEHAHDLITLLDEKGQIIYASPSYKTVLGFDPMEYIGQLYFHNMHPEDMSRLDKVVTQSLIKRQPCKLQFKQKHKTKGWIWSELHGTPVFDDKGQFIHMVVITRDISLQKEYESKLKHFAYHDSLTELPNRRLFKEYLTKALSDLKEKRDGLAVIMMDIDDFKTINDQMGHDVGDEVIAEVGKRVRNHIRDIDMVARLGGDEFVILFPNIGLTENVTAISEKIQQAMQQPWNINDHALEVTTSMGIAMAMDPLQDISVSSMLKNADEALYEAKNSGKNTYTIRTL